MKIDLHSSTESPAPHTVPILRETERRLLIAARTQMNNNIRVRLG